MKKDYKNPAFIFMHLGDVDCLTVSYQAQGIGDDFDFSKWGDETI